MAAEMHCRLGGSRAVRSPIEAWLKFLYFAWAGLCGGEAAALIPALTANKVLCGFSQQWCDRPSGSCIVSSSTYSAIPNLFHVVSAISMFSNVTIVMNLFLFLKGCKRGTLEPGQLCYILLLSGHIGTPICFLNTTCEKNLFEGVHNY